MFKIQKILQVNQPDIYREFNKIRARKQKPKQGNTGPHIEKHIKSSDIKECMQHGTWRRYKGGVMKQVRR